MLFPSRIFSYSVRSFDLVFHLILDVSVHGNSWDPLVQLLYGKSHYGLVL